MDRMTFMRIWRTGLLAVLLYMTAQAVHAADPEEQKAFLYRWTDERGIIHLTDNLGKVPKRYRDAAVKMEQTQSTESGERSGPQEDRASRPDPSGTDSEAEDELRKAEWQGRIRDWKARLDEAEQRIQQLENERDALFIQQTLAPLEARQRAEQIERELRVVQQQREEAKNMLSVVIPNEARRAGVPPGWLRE